MSARRTADGQVKRLVMELARAAAGQQLGEELVACEGATKGEVRQLHAALGELVATWDGDEAVDERDILRCRSCGAMPRRKDFKGHVAVEGVPCDGVDFEVAEPYTGRGFRRRPAHKNRIRGTVTRRRRRWRALPDEIRLEIRKAAGAGETYAAIARRLDVDVNAVERVVLRAQKSPTGGGAQ